MAGQRKNNDWHKSNQICLAARTIESLVTEYILKGVTSYGKAFYWIVPEWKYTRLS